MERRTYAPWAPSSSKDKRPATRTPHLVIRALIADERQRSHALRTLNFSRSNLAHGKERRARCVFRAWQINATTNSSENLILDGMATAAPLQHGDSLRLLANHQADYPIRG